MRGWPTRALVAWTALVFATPIPALGGGLEARDEINLGPTALLMPGPVARDQPLHYGFVLGHDGWYYWKTLRDHRDGVPLKWWIQAEALGYLRVFHWYDHLVPDTIIVSHPAMSRAGSRHTGTYGVSWRPTAFGIVDVSRSSHAVVILWVAPRLTYLYLGNERDPKPTHFLRPGIEAFVSVELTLSQDASLAFGWGNHFYIPQRVGGGVFDVGPLRDDICYMGQPWMRLYLREAE